jgi:hypothetical protein
LSLWPAQLFASHYEVGEVLGKGAFATVFRATKRDTGVEYALKQIALRRLSGSSRERLLREIQIMQLLDHPHIIKVTAVYRSPTKLLMVMDLCTGGSLLDKLKSNAGGRFTEVQAQRYVSQMLYSLNYLHSNGIVHRDIKLENFVFSDTSPNARLVLIDFGLSRSCLREVAMTAMAGSSYYFAPEVLKGQYGEASVCDSLPSCSSLFVACGVQSTLYDSAVWCTERGAGPVRCRKNQMKYEYDLLFDSLPNCTNNIHRLSLSLSRARSLSHCPICESDRIGLKLIWWLGLTHGLVWLAGPVVAWSRYIYAGNWARPFRRKVRVSHSGQHHQAGGGPAVAHRDCAAEVDTARPGVCAVYRLRNEADICGPRGSDDVTGGADAQVDEEGGASGHAPAAASAHRRRRRYRRR